MRQVIDELTIATPGQGLHEITREVVSWVADQRIATGLLGCSSATPPHRC